LNVLAGDHEVKILEVHLYASLNLSVRDIVESANSSDSEKHC
jgi:hypothetical protein